MNIATGTPVDTITGRVERASSVHFFSFPEGTVTSIDSQIEKIKDMQGVEQFEFKLKEGDKVNKITSSLNRYGQFIVSGTSTSDVIEVMNNVKQITKKYISVN